MAEPTEEMLAKKIEEARERFASDGMEEFATFQKDFEPVAKSAPSIPEEGFLGIEPLTDEEFERVSAAEEEQAMREWEAVRKWARLEKLIKRSELPAMFEEFRFSSFDAGPSESVGAAYERATEYASNFPKHAKQGRGLVLAGSVGTGKTHLAVAIMRHVLKRFEVPVLFVTMPGLLESERRSYDGEGIGMVESAKHADLLILDDLGAERATEWAQEKLFYLVNHRYAQGLPIVATTNHELFEAAGRVGHRCMSRLAERCEWVSITGDDYRLRAWKGEGA